MKRKILFVFLSVFLNSYSQKIEKRIGDFKIKKESFLIKDKKRISKSVFYFDSSGKILEKIRYGRHHYNKLDVIGEIEQFTYLNGKLGTSRKYISDCQSCQYYCYYTLFDYNFDNNLISKKTYRAENDSLFMKSEYLYKPNNEEIHFNSSTYYENKYDEENRIIEQSQKFEENNQIRSKREFTYSAYNRVSKFQTYYKDGNDYSELETITYDSDKKIISKETIREKSKTKRYYSYNRKGIIEKIEEYESFLNGKYELKYKTYFKINKKSRNIDKIVVDKINSELMES